MPDPRHRARLTSGEWRRVCAVLDRVHEAPPGSREAALAQGCREQGLAIDDVRPFVDAQARSDALPEQIPAELISDAFSDVVEEAARLRLDPGMRLGPYEIVASVGTGGMGEVYRATDTRLDRTVAVKVLRPHVLARADARQRFDQEARAISSLNHPHVCTLHDVGHQEGVDFLVMEYVEGETLAARLRQGPLPLAQAIRFGSQIADALDRAHRQGIVHRDLKPANIMITRAGVKLLDFGLALVGASDAPDGRARIGTPQYMSPEQLQGGRVDARSDIYACGAVLYEMVTGTRELPPAAPFIPGAPAALDWTLARCLATEPDDRWQSAADLKHHLDWIAAGADAPAAVPGRGRSAVWAAAVIALGILAAGGWVWTRHAARPAPGEPAVFAVEPPAGTTFALTQALSRDGRRIAFTAMGAGGTRELWVRSLNALTAQRIAGSAGAAHPFWSPDGQFIGFFADRKLKKVELASGRVEVICDAGSGGGGTWNANGVILFSPASGVTTGLQRVSASGGAPTPVTMPDDGLRIDGWPQFLPDGERFIYMRAGPPDPGIYAGRLDSAAPHARILPLSGTGSKAIAAAGVLFFLDQGALVAQRFDDTRLALTGEPVRVAENIYVGSPGIGAFDAAAGGVVTYRQPALARSVQLTWVDNRGRNIGLLGQPGRYVTVAMSNDGRFALASRWDDGGRASTGTVTRIDTATGAATPLFPRASSPVWPPDGSRAAFTQFQAARGPTPVVAPIEGGIPPAPLAIFGPQAFTFDWSRDGRFVIGAAMHAETGTDIWIAHAEGREPVRYLAREPFHQHEPQISPDGRWVAYTGTDGRGATEIYVRSFHDGGRLRRVSTRGGRSPRWGPDGRALYYVEENGRLMRVPVAADAAFSPGMPELLFRHAGLADEPQASFAGFAYDISPDGERFLIGVQSTDAEPPPPTIVMLDWAFPRAR